MASNADEVRFLPEEAESGEVHAQFDLAMRHSTGDGVLKSWRKAAVWYQRAAVQGYALAQCNLGMCYAHGLGVAQSWPIAVHWFRQGCPSID
ncbi:tetratricopeptide repeat protein [Burkholderia pseudomallei]|uniref:tetratricopeptide repeat protein n=1 Tax=Burkholderia pseudomallei TaxID=28450 RepID=UPI0011C4E67C